MPAVRLSRVAASSSGPSGATQVHATADGPRGGASVRHGATGDTFCLVVMYHYVHDREAPRRDALPGLSGAEFRAQLEQLAREREPVSWPRFLAWQEGRGGMPRRGFLLTFDDGLAEHSATVSPILEELGIKGTFLVPLLPLVEGRMLAAHAVHLLLATMGDAGLSRELDEVLGQLDPTAAGVCQADETAAARMYHYERPERARLKYLLTMQLPADLRDRAVELLFERHIGSSRRWAQQWYLRWEDVRELSGRGHTVGGHGYRHEPYQRLSAEECLRDACRAADILREALGPDPRPFSYPYGSAGDAAERAVRSAGFVQAFTTISGLVRRDATPFGLPRVDTIAVDTFLKSSSCEVGQG